MSTANSLALDARLIIEETLNKNGGLFVESGRTNFEYLFFVFSRMKLWLEPTYLNIKLIKINNYIPEFIKTKRYEQLNSTWTQVLYRVDPQDYFFHMFSFCSLEENGF